MRAIFVDVVRQRGELLDIKVDVAHHRFAGAAAGGRKVRKHRLFPLRVDALKRRTDGLRLRHEKRTPLITLLEKIKPCVDRTDFVVEVLLSYCGST